MRPLWGQGKDSVMGCYGVWVIGDLWDAPNELITLNKKTFGESGIRSPRMSSLRNDRANPAPSS